MEIPKTGPQNGAKVTANSITSTPPARGFHFQPFKPPNRTSTIMPYSDTPVDLFQQFVPTFLVEKWVLWTNAWVAYLLAEAEAGRGKALGPRARIRS